MVGRLHIHQFIVFAAFITLLLADAPFIEPIYATWAHNHVVWINGKEQNQS